nr:tetratricopeptide repeat protein [Paraburkholderia phenoliruptrix]
MTSTDSPSDLSIAYLEAWLRVQPDNTEILSVLATQYVRLNRNEDARRIATRMEALDSYPMRRASQLLRLTVDSREAFALPASDPHRTVAVARVRTELSNAVRLSWSNADLQMLAEAAASVGEQQLAGQLYARLAEQDPAQQTHWNQEAVRFAMYGSDYRGAANAWFRMQASSTTFSSRRQCFINGILALQSGNLLDEALYAASRQGKEFARDHETLILLLKLARAANRPDLIDGYAKALAGYAEVHPNEASMVRLVDFLRKRARNQGKESLYVYMDGPHPHAELAGRASQQVSSAVALQRSGVYAVRVAASWRMDPGASKVTVADTSAAAMETTAHPSVAPARAAVLDAAAVSASEDVSGLLYQSFLESGDVANAQRVAEQEVDKHPRSPVWTKRLAQVAEWNHAAPRALQMWVVYAQVTRDPDGWKNVMRLAPMLNDDNAYLAALIEAANASPASLSLIDSVTATYERLGRPDEALAFLREHRRSGSAEAIELRLGLLAERSGHDDEALASYRNLNSRFPNNTQYAMHTASLLYRRGDYGGALSALLDASKGAKNEDVLFWRNVAQLARLLQRDDIAEGAYKRLLASGKAAPEDLSAMTYFYDAYPVDAGRIAELQFQRDRSPRALQSAIHHFTDVGYYQRVADLLKSLTPEELRSAESDPAFLRARAEYYRASDRPLDALHDLQRAVGLPGAAPDLRAALLWNLVDYGDDAQLREAVAQWRDASAQAPLIWGPLAAALMRLGQPEAALRYLRLQSTVMSRDPLWQLTYAEAQEMAGRGQLAWSIRRAVWRQMQQEEAAIRVSGSQDDAATLADAPVDGEVREQFLGRRASLASIFENADVSRAFLIDLIASDAGRNVSTQTRRTLLGDTAGLPPVEPTKARVAASPEEARLTSSVARDVALAWAISHEANPLAKRWLARQYANALVQPSEQLLAIALAENDRSEMERLLEQRGARLPLLERIDASIVADRPGAAEDLAFRGLEGAPDSAELHQFLERTALAWPQSIDAGVTSYAEHPLDYVEQTLAGSLKIADFYMVGLTGNQRFQHSTDVSQLTNVPSVDRSVAMFVRRQTYDTAFMVTVSHREALDSFNGLAIEAEWGRSSPLSFKVKTGYNQMARESQPLLVGGMKDNVLATVAYRATRGLYATGTVEADRFYSQSRHFLGSGLLTTGEIGYKFRTEFPDYTLRLIGANGNYRASGSPDALISRLIPANTGTVGAAAFIPQTYTQYGLFFGFGSELIDQYTRAWRPFLDVGVLRDSLQGWGPEVSMGLAGSVFGGDHAAVFFSHQRVSRLGTPVTLFGVRYSWFF